jgi:hypothetical protein
MMTKFNQKETTEENYVLFVGTTDYLREQTIKDLIEYTMKIKWNCGLLVKTNGLFR